jgi:cytochrome c oxidase subunit 1
MLVLTLPWHWVGLLGMPRRMSYYDFSDPALANQAWTVTASVIGGALLVASAALFVLVLARGRRASQPAPPYTFSRAVHEGARVPRSLNGLGLWVGMMIALTIVNYGYPIAQLALTRQASVPVIPVGER